MTGKRVAIIGAGPAGLTSAKYALENGLLPTIFEKSNDVGGLWSRSSSNKAVWDGLYSNISYYTEQFSDHPWPTGSLMFPSAKDLYIYLKSYAKRFLLEDITRFNNKIELVEQQGDKKWRINSIDLLKSQKKTEIFDFFICANGLHSKPRVPVIENSKLFKGLQIHSSQFKLNDPRLESKSVAVV
jgi:dimethylaniline monooxygenase (N-oxide forming)